MQLKSALLVGLLGLGLGWPQSCEAAKARVGENIWAVGIPSERFEPVVLAGQQRSMNWCWAACIQMVLNYHGIPVTQEQVVARTFGALIDAPGQPGQILANLNGWGVDGAGHGFLVSAASATADARVAAVQIVRDLEAEQPLIIGIQGFGTGHACVVTAATYSLAPGGLPVIEYITLRDPMPGRESKATLPWAQVAQSTSFLARVRLQRDTVPQRALGIQVGPHPVVGVTILAVADGSAAAQARLAVGDVIVELADRPIVVVQDLANAMVALGNDEATTLTVQRGAQTLVGEVRWAEASRGDATDAPLGGGTPRRPRAPADDSPDEPRDESRDESRDKAPPRDDWAVTDPAEADVTLEQAGEPTRDDTGRVVVQLLITNGADEDTYKVRVTGASLVVADETDEVMRTIDTDTASATLAPGSHATITLRLKAKTDAGRPRDGESLAISLPLDDDGYKQGKLKLWRKAPTAKGDGG